MFLIAAFLIQVVSSTPAQASCNVATAQRYIRGFNEAVRGESVLAYIAKNARLFKECYTSVDARNNPVFDSSQLATVGGPAVDREAESLERACMTSRGGGSAVERTQSKLRSRS